MWAVKELRDIKKICKKLPAPVVKKYELWKKIVVRHGPEKLKAFPGFHDEKLIGRHAGECSSRLSLQHRVIYSVNRGIVTVFVLEITPHK